MWSPALRGASGETDSKGEPVFLLPRHPGVRSLDVDRRQRFVLRALDKYIEGLGELSPRTLKPMTREWYQFVNKWGVSPKVFVITPTESPLIGQFVTDKAEDFLPASRNCRVAIAYR
jgi:hypothetical protein